MLSWLWEIFKDPDNRYTISWIGGATVAVAGGIWACGQIFCRAQKADGTKGGGNLTDSSEKEIYAEKLSPLFDFEILKSEALQRAFREFEDNVLRPLVLRNMESKRFDIFEGFRWEIQPRINILLGRNGYGKTRLLQAIVAAMTKDDERSTAFFKAGAEDASFRIELQRAASQGDVGSEDSESELIEQRRKRSFEKTVGKMPILAISDSRFINKSRTDIMPVDLLR